MEQQIIDTLLNTDQNEPQILGAFPTSLVGRRYYKVHIPPRSKLTCRREPGNEHDTNAIALHLESGQKVGHLPHYDAIYLAPLLDSDVIKLDVLLTDNDNPNASTQIWVIVLPASQAALLSDKTGNSQAALWHHQFLHLWQNRLNYTREALFNFCYTLDDLAGNKELWPESLLIYNMLKGTAQAKAFQEEAEREQREQLKRQEAEKARLAELNRLRNLAKPQLCSVQLQLHFGHITILPLKTPHPSPTTALLSDAIRSGLAGISSHTIGNRVCKLQVDLKRNLTMVAIKGESINTKLGALRVIDDQLFTAGEPVEKRILNTVFDNYKDHQRNIPVLLADDTTTEPDLPQLPKEATGYAIFHGDTPQELLLAANHETAEAAMLQLRHTIWQLPPEHPASQASHQLAILHKIIDATVPEHKENEMIFNPFYGIYGKAHLDDTGKLSLMRLKLDKPFQIPNFSKCLRVTYT